MTQFTSLTLLFYLLVLPTRLVLGQGNIATTTRYWDCSGGACGCGYLAGGDTTKETHCHR